MDLVLHNVSPDKLPFLVEMAKLLGVRMEQFSAAEYNSYLNELLEEGEQSGLVKDFEPEAFLKEMHHKHL